MSDFVEGLGRRVLRARAALKRAGVDACLVTHLPSVAWLTGFRGSSGTLIVTPAWLYFITDFRYSRAVELLQLTGRLPEHLEIEIVERQGDERAAAVLRERGASVVGFEADHLSVRRFRTLERLLAPVRLEPLFGTLERLRAVKDAEEVRVIRDAAARLRGVALRLAEFARAGREERQIAADIDHAMRLAGFERPAFETIVASGPNSALPHARPTDRRLVPGDPVVLDFGGVYGGYCVDLTRTAVVGRATESLRHLHEAVLAAQQAAVSVVRPGVRASEIDRAARDELGRRGLGEAFGHATGHGLGLEVHEYPRIGRAAPERQGESDDDPAIEAGMVFTIEPGAYVPSIGGVRIEDDVLVSPSGADVLTDIPRDLLVLGA